MNELLEIEYLIDCDLSTAMLPIDSYYQLYHHLTLSKHGFIEYSGNKEVF